MCPVSKRIADEKGYKGAIFAVATVLFSGIGLLCACALPYKKDETAEAVRALIEKLSSDEKPTENKRRPAQYVAENPRVASPKRNPRPVEAAERDFSSRREAPATYADEGEAASLGWQVGTETPAYEAPAPRAQVRSSYIPRGSGTANSILKDGRLVCSACLSPIGFNDETCRRCGAKIVPAEGSEGGFFLKKL